MDFTYDDEQLALQDVARAALERECGPDVVRQLADDPDAASGSSGRSTMGPAISARLRNDGRR